MDKDTAYELSKSFFVPKETLFRAFIDESILKKYGEFLKFLLI